MSTLSVPDNPSTLPPICLIGGGQMGRALVGGLIDAGGIQENQVHVVDPNETSLNWWNENRPQTHLAKSLSALDDIPGIVILAVKPNVIPTATNQPAGTWDGKLVISIAAGVSLEQLKSNVGHGRIVRVMPNTPALIGQGACAYATAEEVESADRLVVETMLGATGIVVPVEESQLDAVTGLSGSGPAYVFLIIEAMADGGVTAGLPREMAMKLATQTVLGSAAMVAQTGRHPGELKDAVASPAGTTIAGLSVLEQNGVRGAIIDAITKASQRSRELGGQGKK